MLPLRFRFHDFLENQLALFPIHYAPADYRINHIGLLYLFGVDQKDVARENDYVCKLARFERAFNSFSELCISARRSVSSDGFFDSDLLFRYPPARVLAVKGRASDRRIYSENRRERSYRPIRSEDERSIRVEKR